MKQPGGEIASCLHNAAGRPDSAEKQQRCNPNRHLTNPVEVYLCMAAAHNAAPPCILKGALCMQLQAGTEVSTASAVTTHQLPTACCKCMEPQLSFTCNERASAHCRHSIGDHKPAAVKLAAIPIDIFLPLCHFQKEFI